MNEIRINRVIGGTASPDGHTVLLNVETPQGLTSLSVVWSEARKLPIATMQAIGTAEKNRAKKGMFAFNTEAMRVTEDQVGGTGLLWVKLLGAARPMLFEVTRKSLDGLYDDIRALRKKLRGDHSQPDEK